jgi:hypothetical protein
MKCSFLSVASGFRRGPIYLASEEGTYGLRRGVKFMEQMERVQALFVC